MARIIAIANVKGGVGKTTVSANLSAALAERGRKVLAVDLDPQASLTLSLGFKPDQLSQTISSALGPSATSPESFIVPTHAKFDLAPAGHDLRDAERELEQGRIRILALRHALESVKKQYDYILLDCPANAGILTGNALAAADELVIPFPADHLALQALHWFIRIVKDMQRKMVPHLRIAGLFLAIYDPRLRHASEVVAEVQEDYATEIPFFSATVRQAVAFKQASRLGQTILEFAPHSQAAEAYRKLACEIEEGIQEPPGENAYAMVRQGRAALISKDRDRAYFLFYRATKLNSQLGAAWLGRAQSAEDWVDAVRSYVQALLLAPADKQAFAEMDSLLVEHLPGAMGSDLPEVMALAHHLASNGFTECAEKTYSRATELDESLTEAWVGRARSAPSAPEAVRFFQRAVELAPEDSQIQAELQTAEQRVKSQAAALVNQATALLQEGSKQSAHDLFRQAVELDPQNEFAWVGCARTSDDLDKALEFAQQALKINPMNVEARELHSWLWRPERDWSDFVQQPSAISIALAVLIILVSFVLIAHLYLHWI